LRISKVLLATVALWIPIVLAVGPDHSIAGFPKIGLQSNKSVEGFESLTTEEAMLKALTAARMPGGIVRKVDCKSEDTRRRLFPSALTLQQTIELIKQLDPRYRLLTAGGVINLLPNGTEPELLKVRIKEYRVEKVRVPNLAIESLLALPEVKKKSAALANSEALRLGGLSSPSEFATPLTLHVKNVSLRDTLNQIARAYGNGIWRYTEFSCGGKNEFSLDLIAQ